MLIYCDSVILIYFLDAVGPFNSRAVSRLAALQSSGDSIAVSELTRLECRVKPLRLGALKTLTDFDAFFTLPGIHLATISRAVFERATAIRAKYNFKLGDSLHLATAVEAGCDRFLTNDGRLSAFTDITVEILP